MQRIHYGQTYIRKRISLTFLVKKLILWSEGLFQTLLSNATYLYVGQSPSTKLLKLPT
jgi:hypothetical protein